MKALIEREMPDLELEFFTDVEEELELEFFTDVEEEFELEFDTSPNGDAVAADDEEEKTSDEADMEEGPGDDYQLPEENFSDSDSEPEDAEDLALEVDTEDESIALDSDADFVADDTDITEADVIDA
jgi:hypothetical protein